MKKREFDLKKLILDVFDPQPREKMLIVCDVPHDNIKTNDEWQERIVMAKKWHAEILSISKNYGFELYDDILFYRATGVNNGLLPEIGTMNGKNVLIREMLENLDVCIAMTEFSATAPLTDFAMSGNRLRVASMPGVKESMETTALSADYRCVAKKCAALTPKLTRATGALILFSTDHHLYVDLRKRRAKSDDGICHKNRGREFATINLPSGESFIAPYEGENKEIGKSMTSGFIPVVINGESVVYRIDGNKIVEVLGTGPEAEKRRTYLNEDRGRRNVAELGLGVNDRAVLSGSVLEDEKVGPHIGLERSDHIGGSHGIKDFEDPKKAGHFDIVYAKECCIKITSLVLHYDEKEKECIIQDGDYVKSLFS